MRLRRQWPAICIWAVFSIFNIVMVASSSFFLGIFPSEDIFVYCGVFTGLSILVMSLLTLVLGQFTSGIDLNGFLQKRVFKVLYALLILNVILFGVFYRVHTLSLIDTGVTGKMSLYENAMVGGAGVEGEYDLLSIAYSSILKLVLFFTGNFLSVPFYFQIACFTVFMICSFFTVKKLLGYLAAFVYLAYVSFMPVFTPAFSGLELSTDSLFMAMFGIEMLLIAIYLKRAYEGKFRSKINLIYYLIVGAAIGFMAYIDAGTIIMVVPFLFASLFLCGRSPKKEFGRVMFVILAAVICFAAMIVQEQGFMMADVRLSNWANYYFHNLNTFSMFWAYTDHKFIYLITLVAMSGIIVGFWRNRNTERVSPWLLSTILIFSTVPFMGATRMNTQVFVTVYYAFILGCVASLIAMSPSEKGEYIDENAADEDEVETESEEAVGEIESEENAGERAEISEETASVEKPAEQDALEEPANEVEESGAEPEADAVSVSEPEPESEPEAKSEPEPESEAKPEPEPESEAKPEPESEPEAKSEPQQRFVPEGMVLPMDDEDADLTPRMKMPEFKGRIGSDGKMEKLKVKSSVKEKVEPADDFDIELSAGDDFDI